MRLLRTDAAVFNNNATQCYDRVLANLSQIACQHLGLSESTAAFVLEFFWTSKYFIKTVHGVSTDFNSDTLHPLFGMLQGSGASPAMWLVISTILITVHNTKFQTSGIPNPTYSSYLSKLLDAFVDDADLWDILLSSTKSPSFVAHHLQKTSSILGKATFYLRRKIKI